VAWGYEVLAGSGSLTHKTNESNNEFRPDSYVTLESNAGSENMRQCGPPPPGGYNPPATAYGTRVLWEHAPQEAVARDFLATIQELWDTRGGEVPGPDAGDRICTPNGRRPDGSKPPAGSNDLTANDGPASPGGACSSSTLHQLREVTATHTALIEYAYHVFQEDRDDLEQRDKVAWAVAHAIGRRLGDTTGVGCGYPTCPQPI